MPLQVDSSSRVPIYRQLTGQIRESVARGGLKPEAKLPSVRELSKELVVNPNTVARAYQELEREGILTTRPGLGVFVAHPRAELTKKARTERLVELIDHLLTEAVHLGFSSGELQSLVGERAEQFQFVAGDS